MANLTGKKFGLFTVVRTATEAANRWKFADFCWHYCNNLPEGSLESKISNACCEDDYAEMKEDPYIMGVGLYTYQQSLRA